MIWKQMRDAKSGGHRVQNLSGGVDSAMSLAQLSDWCAERFGPHKIGHDPTSRAFDIPWMVLDSTRAKEQWNWQPARKIDEILTEIASHAEKHPNWLEISAVK
jgi:CDP-paratose 2-epimerase